MIAVDVALYATLRKYRPDGEKRGTFRMQVADGATVAEILAALSIPSAQSKLIFVNNVGRDEDHVLNGDERVAIFPPIAGG